MTIVEGWHTVVVAVVVGLTVVVGVASAAGQNQQDPGHLTVPKLNPRGQGVCGVLDPPLSSDEDMKEAVYRFGNSEI